MKNRILALLLLALPVLHSCSDDDEATLSEPSVTAEQLIGKWRYDKQIFALNHVTQPTVPYAGNQDGCAADFLQFGTQQVTSGDYGGGCALTETTGTWSVNHRTIHVAMGGETRTFAVEQITGTTMQLRQLETGDNVYRYTFIKGTLTSS